MYNYYTVPDVLKVLKYVYMCIRNNIGLIWFINTIYTKRYLFRNCTSYIPIVT